MPPGCTDDTGRAARELAQRAGATLVELVCTCPPDVAEERIERRARTGLDASEANVEVARELAASADPWPEACEIDTDVLTSDAATAALSRIDEVIRS